MAKEAPTFSVIIDDAAAAAKTISNDVTNLSISTPRGVQDVTGVNSAAVERLLLAADGTVSLSGVFNSASDMSHDVMKDAGPTSTVRTSTLATSGNTLSMEGYLSAYNIARAQDGSLAWDASLLQTTTTAPTWS